MTKESDAEMVRRAIKECKGGKPSQTADCSEFKKKYDEQVRILYNETNDPAKGVKYRLIEKGTGKILAEGKTDKQGLTERVSTGGESKDVSIQVIRLNDDRKEEEKDAGVCKTNDQKDSIHDVKIWRGQIYFDFRYVHPVKDKAKSFIHAAETTKRKTKSYGKADEYRGDVWWSFEVTCEDDIKMKWQELHDLQQEVDMEAEEGHIFTHATKGNKSGLSFEDDPQYGCGIDSILTSTEIRSLPKLKWSNSSSLWLYSCRSGLALPNEGGKSIADVFFDAQNSVKAVIALRGYGYFSYSSTEYQEIASDEKDMRDVYLLAFRRTQNVSKLNAGLYHLNKNWDTGSLVVIPPYIIRR
jgi:hypothetical protein